MNPSEIPANVAGVLAAYGIWPEAPTFEPLGGAGGFSGAQLWRFQADGKTLCLRRWPREHPSPPRLCFIHSVMEHAHRRGFQLLPLPLRTRRGATLEPADGTLWELTPWLPGAPLPSLPASEDQVMEALRVLAEFHLAAADFPDTFVTLGVAFGLHRRREQLRRLLQGGFARLQEASRDPPWPELREWAPRLAELMAPLGPAILAGLERAVGSSARLQPCLRDIWRDHVLFQGDKVSGIVDWGAVDFESVAADVARLLGSLAGDDPALREAGLKAYLAVRPLDRTERDWVEVYDASGVLLGCANWLQWLIVERREFEDRRRVLERLQESLGRLLHLTDKLHGSAG